MTFPSLSRIHRSKYHYSLVAQIPKLKIGIKGEERIKDEMILKKGVHPIVKTTMALWVHHHASEIVKQVLGIKNEPDNPEDKANPIDQEVLISIVSDIDTLECLF